MIFYFLIDLPFMSMKAIFQKGVSWIYTRKVCSQNTNPRTELFKILKRQQHRFSNLKGKAE